jgi:hypothetical protein
MRPASVTLMRMACYTIFDAQNRASGLLLMLINENLMILHSGHMTIAKMERTLDEELETYDIEELLVAAKDKGKRPADEVHSLPGADPCAQAVFRLRSSNIWSKNSSPVNPQYTSARGRRLFHPVVNPAISSSDVYFRSRSTYRSACALNSFNSPSL